MSQTRGRCRAALAGFLPVLAFAAAVGAQERVVAPDPKIRGAVEAIRSATARNNKTALKRWMGDTVTVHIIGDRGALHRPLAIDEFLPNWLDRKSANPFHSAKPIDADLMHVRAAPGKEARLRVKYRGKLQIMTGAATFQSKSDVLLFWDLDFRQVGGGYRLVGVHVNPADYVKDVGGPIVKMVQGQPKIGEAAILRRYNTLMAAFVMNQPKVAGGGPVVGGGPAPVLLENPPPILLPPNRVTPAVRGYRRAINAAVARKYPRMKGRLILESFILFRGKRLYMNVFQRAMTVTVAGRGYSFTIRVVFSYDGAGNLHDYIIPIIEPKAPPVVIPPPPKPIKAPLPRVHTTVACMVLTNYAQLRRNHPDIFPKIRTYLESFGPVIDLSTEGIDAADYRAVDRVLEKRFDRKRYGCLFIFGNHDVVPFGEYANPLFGVRKDKDSIVYSDDYYADFDHDRENDYDIIVTRMPDDRGILGDKGSVLYRPVPSGDRLEHEPFVVYGNRNWPVSEFHARMGDPARPLWLKSDPTTDETFSAGFFRGKNAILNLHGGDGDALRYWGENAAGTPLTAMTLRQADAPGSIILSTTCYGSSILRIVNGKIVRKTSDDCMALRFLRNGARAFIAPTKVGYISTTPERCSGLWGKLFMQHAHKGVTPQRAFMLAKREYAETIGSPADPTQFKMCHQMVYFGLPPMRSHAGGGTVTILDGDKPVAVEPRPVDRIIRTLQGIQAAAQGGSVAGVRQHLAAAFVRTSGTTPRRLTAAAAAQLIVEETRDWSRPSPFNKYEQIQKNVLQTRKLTDRSWVAWVRMWCFRPLTSHRRAKKQWVYRVQVFRFLPEGGGLKLSAWRSDVPAFINSVVAPHRKFVRDNRVKDDEVAMAKYKELYKAYVLALPKARVPGVGPPIVLPPGGGGTKIPPVVAPPGGGRIKVPGGARNVLTYPNGNRYEGALRDGVPHGRGVLLLAPISPRRLPRYEGDWSNGKMHGRGSYYFSDGARYVGRWSNDLMHGYGIYYYADGSRYEGQWQNNVRLTGKGTHVTKDGVRHADR